MNLVQIAERFPDELSCIEYAEEIRWGDEISCPNCGYKRISNRHSDYRYKCYECQNSFSVTTQSLLHNTRLPLKKWFFALSVFTDGKKGVSALQMQRHLGISYPTAHRMLMLIREMMDDLEAGKRIDGVIEMDETYVGGKPRKPGFMELSPQERKEIDRDIEDAYNEKGLDINEENKTTRKYPSVNVKRGRGTNKTPVVGMVSRDGDVIVKVMEKLTYRELRKMVQDHIIADESVLITDEYRGYDRMSEIIDHISINHQKAWSYNGADTNTIEGFWASIKRAIVGTYHQVSVKNLPLYVVEIAFKYNNRQDNDAMFDILLTNALTANDRAM